MPQNIFPQNIIAIIWDFDKTLIPDYMEKPLFRHFNVDEKKFWQEVENLPAFYKKNGLDLVSRDTLYLNHILTYVRSGIFPGLNNQLLRQLGAQLEFYPGLPEFFEIVKEKLKNNPEYQKHELKIEHYILSTGLRQIILGSKIAPYIDGVWGCEFVEKVAPAGYLDAPPDLTNQEKREILDIGYMLDNTTKTRAIFEINKGSNVIAEIDVNAMIRSEDRRVPIQNMIYVADGPSDIPVFSIVNQNGGKTFAVYQKGSESEFAQANELQKQARLQSFGEADYREGSKTYLWILAAVDEIAKRILRDKARALDEQVGPAPRHLA